MPVPGTGAAAEGASPLLKLQLHCFCGCGSCCGLLAAADPLRLVVVLLLPEGRTYPVAAAGCCCCHELI